MRKVVVLLLTLLLIPEMALTGFFTVGAFLASTSQAPANADLVMVLGGGDGARYTRGRELLAAGYSNRLFLSHPTPAERKAALPGVQIYIDDEPANTWQEGRALRALMDREGLRSVLVVSDPPHMLRVRYCLFSAFRGSDVVYRVIASEPSWWNPWRWWGNAASSSFVGDEILGLGYYLVRYRFGLL